MPPTIQTNKVPDREQRPSRPTEKRTELVCRIKYCNTLPDLPFDPKFIQYPFDANRYLNYKPTTLERNFKHEVHVEHDLGVTIDLINKDAYNPEPGAVLDPADEKLLEEDILTPQDSVRSRHHARSVSWLRRTEYISTEQTRFQPQNMDKVEAKVGFSIKKNLKEDPLIMDRETQIKAILKTFEDSQKLIEKHYSKPNVYPVEVLPVYPDFECWKYPCAQVIFDSDPAPVGRSVPAQIEEMSQAMIRGVMDESGEQFVAYFLPTEETLVKRRSDVAKNLDYEDDQEYEYKMAREYNWNVKNKASKGYEENYFLVLREGGMYYNELETRVRLSKRRQKPGTAPSNTRLVIKHRPINELEYKMQRYRERQLEPPNEEDEEEEEPEAAPENVTITRTGEKAKTSDDEEKKSGSEAESENESDKEDDKRSRRKSVDEGSGSDNETRKSRSRSRSGSRSSSANSKVTKTTRQSRSRSHSGSRSRSASRSKSGSGSDNETKKSRSRSSSRSSGSKKSSATKASRASRKQSKSPSGSRSRSNSANRSGSGSDNETKRSRSRSGSRSSSAHSNVSGSTRRSKSTRANSPNENRSRSGSRSNSGSRSGDASD